ncbi:MAG: FkbM family methyltransferase [Candidatus Micrarchaeales archaeon]|nr:FkbM family methyltransferase [Candidatus Micrarchaeales archaeon]
MKSNITKSDYIIARINRFGDIHSVRKIVRNWHDVLLYRSGLKKRVILRLRHSGKTFEINSEKDYLAFWNSPIMVDELLAEWRNEKGVKIGKGVITVDMNGRVARFLYRDSTELMKSLGTIRETFIDGIYSDLDVSNRQVLDIGGNIADSAIYFSLSGAKKVYALEPYSVLYNMGKRNITRSGVSNRVLFLKAACGGRSGTVDLGSNAVPGSGVSGSGKGGEKLRMFTLEELVRKYKLLDACLKIDCEGCEYSILMDSNIETLQHFKQISMEYHYGYLNIKDRLRRAGFAVTHTRPKYSFHSEQENPVLYYGTLFAESTR